MHKLHPIINHTFILVEKENFELDENMNNIMGSDKYENWVDKQARSILWSGNLYNDDLVLALVKVMVIA